MSDYDWLLDKSKADSSEGLFEQAVEYAIQDVYISTSTLQRKLKIGYARAGRLIDEMEQRGIISGPDGSNPRKCLITRNEWIYMNDKDKYGVVTNLRAVEGAYSPERKGFFGRIRETRNIKQRNDKEIVAKLLQNYDQIIRFHEFGGSQIDNEKNEWALHDQIVRFVLDANKLSDPVLTAAGTNQKRMLDSLVQMGAFQFETKPGGKEIKYRCVVSDAEIEGIFAERRRELNDLDKYDMRKKQAELSELISVYQRIKENEKIRTAVANSKEIIYSADVYDIGMLATPLELNIPPRYSFHDEMYIGNTEKNAVLFGIYRPKYVLHSSVTISQETNYPAEYIRLEKYIQKIFSVDHDRLLANRIDLLDLWGSIINKTYYKRETKFNKQSAEKYYEKIQYLYDSLCEYGLIENKGEVSLQAFLLLIYHVWYETIKSNSVVYDLLHVPLKTPEDCFRYMYSKGIPFNQATWYMAEAAYIVGNEMPVKSLKDYYESSYKTVYDDEQSKEEKRLYVDSLIKGGNSSGIFYSIDDTYSMNGYEFEELISKLFINMGYDSHATKKSGDQGVDVIANKGMTRIAIQTKCYPNSVVGNDAVQEVAAGRKLYKATEAMVITNSTFTQSAIELAEANNVVLWDRNYLADVLERYHVFKEL